MNLKIVSTSDSSKTLYTSQFDEHYHSTHGALNESLHVFIKSGLQHCNLNSIKIFEVGLGTGLNVILTYLETLKKEIEIDYEAIELYPVRQNIIKNLKFDEFVPKEHQNIISKIHESSWDQEITISDKFKLKKINSDFNSFQFEKKFDIIYFDAFAPDKQPGIWSKENFIKIYKSLNNNGILTTYSSKGLVKNNLRSAGFKVKRLSGPKGKRHILRAIKDKQINFF